MRFLLKETFDEIIVSSAFQKNAKNLSKALKTNIIYAGHYYTFGHTDKLRLIILKEMKKYNFQSVMLTRLTLWRFKLITKEIMINYCLGKDERHKKSVNDDLNSFFDDLRLDKNPQSLAHTYFLPKLIDEEMNLIGEKDPIFFRTFMYGYHVDVDEAEMKLSESNSKFVRATGGRLTEIIENYDYQNDSESDTDSDQKIFVTSNSKMNVFEISNEGNQIAEIENEDENKQKRRQQTTTETQNIFRCCFIQ